MMKKTPAGEGLVCLGMRFDFRRGALYTQRSVRRVGHIILLSLLVALPASAQEDADEPSSGQSQQDGQDQDQQGAPEDSPPSLAEESMGIRGISGELLSDADKVPDDVKRAKSDQMVKEAREALQRETEILAEARNNKDIVQLNCVNEKLTPTKALVKKIEEAASGMFEAMAQDHRDLVNLNYTKQTLAHPRVMRLRTEAEQCVGYASVYTGDTVIDVTTDPDLDTGDPTETPLPPVAPATPEVASAA